MTEVLLTKNDPKVLKAWMVFDWANSAYALVISTAIFPKYFVSNTPKVIDIFGHQIKNETFYTFAVSFSYIIIAALSPILSGIADYTGRKLIFLKTFTLLGSIGCICLYFFNGEIDLWLGTAAFVLATISFAGSLVFYDSFLPQIATEDQFDRVSAKGYSYGYIGSVILLVFILMMILKPDWFHITDPGLGPRIGFVLVGMWWLGFAQYTFKYMPKDIIKKVSLQNVAGGYRELKVVFNKALKMRPLLLFLGAFFLYSAGVQTVIYLATIFADKELKMDAGELIIVVLIIQLIGIVGATIFARLSEKIGNIKALLLQVLIWAAICVFAYTIVSTPAFYVAAGLVGMVMGGIQALSRATYSKLVKDENEDVTTFFSLYDVTYKLSIVVGTFLFGLINQLTGNMRYSVLFLTVLFLLSLIPLVQIPWQGRKVER